MKFVMNLLPLLLLSACPGENPLDTGPIDTDTDTDIDLGCDDDDECEDNTICEDRECIPGDRSNGFEEAQSMFLNQPYEGEINPTGDIDYFSYESVGEEWLRIGSKTEQYGEELDTVVAVYRSNGALHAWIDEFATGNVSEYDSLFHVYLPQAGTWYFTVEDRSTWFNDTPQGGDGYGYAFEIQEYQGVTSEDDGANDPSVAVPLSSATTVFSVGVVLEEPGDADWIDIDMDWGSAPIELWGLSNIPGSAATPVVRLFDSTPEQLLEKVDVGPEGPAIYFDAQNEDHLIQIADVDGDGSEDHWFVIYVRTREEGYGNPREVEPNDAFEMAEILPTEPDLTNDGVTYDKAFFQGKLTADGDEDWFAIDAYPGGSTSLSCGGEAYGSMGNIGAELYDANGDFVFAILDGDDSTPDLDDSDPLAGGLYRLRLFSEDGEYGPGAYYRCGWYMYDDAE